MTNLTAKRVEELRGQLKFDLEHGTPARSEISEDLLFIVNDYAEKIKAGAGASSTRTGKPAVATEGSTPSPGLSDADEREGDSGFHAKTIEDSLWFLDNLRKKGYSSMRIDFIKSRLAEVKPAPKVTREWLDELGLALWAGDDGDAEKMLRELGIEVEP